MTPPLRKHDGRLSSEAESSFAVATETALGERTGHRQPHKWLVAAAVLLGAILTLLDGSIVNVALLYAAQLQRGVARISWVVTGYLAAVSVMIPMSGWLSVHLMAGFIEDPKANSPQLPVCVAWFTSRSPKHRLVAFIKRVRISSSSCQPNRFSQIQYYTEDIECVES